MATKSKKQKAPAGGGNHIEDIQHEEVKADKPIASAPVVQEAEVIDEEKMLELTIQKEIKRFNLADDGIAALKKEYSELTIAGIDDKAGYKSVKDAWNLVRSTRTALEKKGLDIRSGYNKITKAVSKEEDRLVDAVKPLEDDLYKKWKAIDDEKEKQKREREEAEQKAFMARLEELTKLGATVKDGYYSIGETIAVDAVTLRSMTEDQWTGFLKAAAAKAAEIAQAKKEKDEADEQERQRLAADKKKLEDQQAELKRKQEEMDERERKLKQQEEQAAKAKVELRLNQLQAIGLTLAAGGREVSYDNGIGQFTVLMTDVRELEDGLFAALVEEAGREVGEAKRKLLEKLDQEDRDRKALEQKKMNINELMVAAGLIYYFAPNAFAFSNTFLTVKHTMEDLVKKSDEELKELTDKLTGQIKEAKTLQLQHEEQQKKQREKERQQQLGDAVNFREYLSKVYDVEMPDLDSVEYQGKLGEFRDRLRSLINQYQPEPEAAKA